MSAAPILPSAAARCSCLHRDRRQRHARPRTRPDARTFQLTSTNGFEQQHQCSSSSQDQKPTAGEVTRRGLALGSAALGVGVFRPATALAYTAPPRGEPEQRPVFTRLDNGLAVLLLRDGLPSGATPEAGDTVEVHYYARLAAKQGWRFDSSYANLDKFGEPIPFKFTVGDERVIEGLSLAVQGMRAGSLVRVIIPGRLGYQNRQQEPIPLEFSDRQRLYTTIFNPTRIANGEGDTLGTLYFDVELLSVRKTRA